MERFALRFMSIESRRAADLILVAGLIALLFCASANATEVAVYSGVASSYKPGSFRWGGRIASNGERIDFVNGMTVAHPLAAWTGRFSFGTCLRVERGTRAVDLRINDNGPHVGKGRVLDLPPKPNRLLKCGGLCRVTFRIVTCEKMAASAGH